MDNPAREYYTAILEIIQYLAATLDEGIYYWRQAPQNTLPDADLPSLYMDNHKLPDSLFTDQSLDSIHAFTDSNWGRDKTHRRSVTGIVIMFAGGIIGYKMKYQDTIAPSSTEAELVTACDTAKLVLFFRSLLDDLGIPQTQATIIYEDNKGALMMANAQQPMRQTRHLDIKHYALLDQVERDLIILKAISTNDNVADAFTKPLSKQLFYRHFDTFMGRRLSKLLAKQTRSTTHSLSSSLQRTQREMAGTGVVGSYVAT